MGGICGVNIFYFQSRSLFSLQSNPTPVIDLESAFAWSAICRKTLY
jgi:hypothetical protein